MKAYTGLYPYAFMSYSHKDEARIKPLIEELQKVGCNIWYDEGIVPMDEWAETVAKKLENATMFFLIMSRNAAESQNVKREIYYAVRNNLPILTFYLEPVDLTQGLEMQLGISQAIYSHNNAQADSSAIKHVFPKAAVAEHSEPAVIYTAGRYCYAFVRSNSSNEYSILRIDRETQQRKVLFRHWDSAAFLFAQYGCESIHFSPSDEFNPYHTDVLYFSVYSELIPEAGTGAPYFYIQVDFCVKNPYNDLAELMIVGGKMKHRDAQPPEEAQILAADSNSVWFRNSAADTH